MDYINQMMDEFDQWVSSLLQQGYSIEKEVDIMLSNTQNPEDQLREIGINPWVGRNFSLEDSISQHQEQEESPMKKARQILAQSTEMKIEKQRQDDHQDVSQEDKLRSSFKDKKITKIAKMGKSKAKIDYKKNIPNYITKTCLSSMLSQSKKKRVEKLCRRQGIQIEELKKKMEPLVQIKMIGLGELSKVLQTNSGVNKVFQSFFTWFLRNKYMIFLLEKGKMVCKEKYISRKNDLLFLVSPNSQYN